MDVIVETGQAVEDGIWVKENLGGPNPEIQSKLSGLTQQSFCRPILIVFTFQVYSKNLSMDAGQFDWQA